jgi:hypothetical protein
VQRLSAKALGVGSLLLGGTALALGAGLGDGRDHETESPAGHELGWFDELDELDDDGDDDEPEARSDQPLVISAPPPPPAIEAPPYLAEVPDDAFRKALAYQFNAPLFARASAERKVVGHVRRNVMLPVARIVSGDGCQGTWYEVAALGYVCSGDGFAVSTNPTPLEDELHSPLPNIERSLPYRYAKLETQGAPSFSRIPSPSEEEQALAGGKGAVVTRLEGAVFIAVDRVVEEAGRRFVRTVRGQYIRHADVRMLEPTSMHGEHFDDTPGPIAFVYADEAVLHDAITFEPRGTATRYARFAVADVVERDAQSWVVTDDGLAIAREHVRVADLIEPHERIPADAKWIHVDLSEQTLVAYEGRTPVMATLVSGGTEGFEAPLGVYRVHKKHITRTMAGPDPDAGRYEVAEVPWTMYYWGSYALHGAYWHDDFGNVRSHGCTNIPPRDARWLFYWSEPEIPQGWHATFGRQGPWLYFTRG